MREIIATGKNLEVIQEQWAKEWNCTPDSLVLEILDKPGVFNRSWKVKVTLPDEALELSEQEETIIDWDGTKYTIKPGLNTEIIVPYPLAGRLMLQGKEISDEYFVARGNIFEFYPISKRSQLSWNIEVAPGGTKATARVRHEHGGSYILAEEIAPCTKLQLERYLTWQGQEDNSEKRSEEDLKKDLAEKGIIYGIKPNIWVEFLTVEGLAEVEVAVHVPPKPTVQPDLIDFVGEPASEDDDENKVDFFGSKLRTCQKDEVLARKIPGTEGTPGIDIFGNIIAVERLKDFAFKGKKNVYLSDDQLEIRASCSGTPLRINMHTYAVENAYIIQKDINLESGSVNFPGDVRIGRDVKDGFYVHAEGKVTVHGSVSGAEIKAEGGLVVKNNIIASKIWIGERHVFRSQFTKALHDLKDELESCILQVEQLQSVSGNNNVGQLLKILLDKKFPNLPSKSEELVNLMDFKDPDYINPELEVAVKTIKRFLIGMGPLQLRDLMYLKNAAKIIEYFLATKGALVSAGVVCETNYVQNSQIKCSGNFVCRKGIYNSNIYIEGDVAVHGVCRGGEIGCQGDVYVWELGGPGVAPTVIKASKNSSVKVDYSYANTRIFLGKELIRIDEQIQKLEVYREKGIVRVEKLKWDGRN